MAQHSQTKSDLLQKPLYIFDLPEELLLSFTLKSNQIIHEPETTSPVAVEERYVKTELECQKIGDINLDLRIPR